ncbi:MAG: ATP-grasp domain-containing protein [Nanoarchaeota archaeon]|nr:ATP-grasp domain-containing protein [Nanoarchaeota archaeon]
MKKNLLNPYELFSNIDRHTSFKEDIVFWLGLRTSDFASIQFIYPDGIGSAKYGKDSLLIEKKYKIISAEKHTKTRTDSDMTELEPYLTDFFLSFKKQPIHIISYHSIPFLENLAAKFPNINLLNPKYSIKKYLDQKTIVRKELIKRGINCIPGLETIVKDKYQFDEIAKKYDTPFIAQFDESASGSGVHLIENHSDFSELILKNSGKPVNFLKYIHGESMNINAVRTRNFVVLSEPSFQIIGQPSCTKRKFGYCGNDFNIGGKISEEHIKEIFNMSKKIGEWLGSLEYYGVFGIDFITDKKNVYFTEINPRFQGSTSLLTDRQIEMGKIPLSFFHLVPYLNGLSVDEGAIQEYNKTTNTLKASQILLHNISGKDSILESSINPGRYRFEDEELKYLGPANFLSETKSWDEVVLAGDIPVNGTRVLNDSDEICRIYTYNETLDKGGRDLNANTKKLVDAVYSKFKFK